MWQSPNQEAPLPPETILPPEGWSINLEHIEEVGISPHDQRYPGIRIVHTLNPDLHRFKVQLTEHWYSPMFGEGDYEPGTLFQHILEQDSSLPEDVGLLFLILRATPRATEQELLKQLTEEYPGAHRICLDTAYRIGDMKNTLNALRGTSLELLVIIVKSLRNPTIIHPSSCNPVNLNITAHLPIPFFQRNSKGELCVHYVDPDLSRAHRRPGLYSPHLPQRQLQHYRSLLAQISLLIPKGHQRIAFNMLPYILDAAIQGKNITAQSS